MCNKNRENLEQLLGQFLDAQEAAQAKEDIEIGRRLLGGYAVPQPGAERIAKIKAEIEQALQERPEKVSNKLVIQVAIAAAVIIIAAVVGVRQFAGSGHSGEKAGTDTGISAAVWEDESISADDADLLVLSAELEQIEDELGVLTSGENGSVRQTELSQLEMQLVEVNSEFWKG